MSDDNSSMEFIDNEKSALKDLEENNTKLNEVITSQPLKLHHLQSETPLKETAGAQAESLFIVSSLCNCLADWWLCCSSCLTACCENGCAECCNGLCEGFTECLESCGECCILCMECCHGCSD